MEIPFPIAEDAGLQTARAYGMVHPAANSSATVRATFVIDPIGVIRAITWYPMTTGRNIDKLLRLVLALQASDEHDALTPARWRPGDPMLEAVAGTYEAAAAMASQEGASDWYYSAKVYKTNGPKAVKK